MRKTRVLIVIPGLNIGGLERVVAHLCRFIDKSRFDIGVCCLKVTGTIGEELAAEGFSVVELKRPRWLRNNYLSWLQLLALVRKGDIDVLHSHTADSLLDAVLCKFARPRTRVVHTFHFGNYPHRASGDLRFERLCARFASQLVAVGDAQKARVADAIGVQEASIRTIWNGVPSIRGKASHNPVDAHRESGVVVIGTACTLIEQKNLPTLLDVAALLKQRGRRALFLIAGEGHMRPLLEDKRSRLGLDRDVRLLGWVHDAQSSFIPHVDIFFLPSLWEAMSMVVLEAMDAGRPVVVTDVGENSRVVESGEDGFVVGTSDVAAMTEALDRLVVDADLRARMGRAAREKVRGRFSVETMVRAYESVYAR